MYTVPQIKKVLVQENIATAAEADEYIKAAEKKEISLIDYILETHIADEDAFFQSLALSIKKPFISLKDKTIRQDILFLIPEAIAKTHEVIAYDKTENGVLKIAAVDPDDIQTYEFIEKRHSMKVEVSLTTPSSIRQILRMYHQSLETEFNRLRDDGQQEDESKNGGADLKRIASDLPIIRLVNSLLEYAIFEGASDIHIEPEETEIAVRYRIDGILRRVMSLPKTVGSGIAARIKILASLKLDEHRLPQDGRFKIEDDNYKISFRVSTLPVFNGEKIVLRLLDEGNQLFKLNDLGFRDADLKKIQSSITRPHGMILVTGPTGSGKTTTLYAILNQLNTPEVNISTIEDPIEYRMPHVNQSQANSKIGFTFASGLRALLRQDPNIIMVGEIRDQETVEIAIQAAMTGHIVLSTLHTNDAPGTLPRLLDMGVVPFLIASTVNIVLAQRLVRKICPHCIMSYTLDKNEIQTLSEEFDIALLMRAIEQEQKDKSAEKTIDRLLFFRGKGCPKCGGTGYKGRMGIYEVLEVSDEIKKLIINRTSATEIRKAAIKEGMSSMMEDGFVKARNGITTIEEVLRVTRE